MLNEKNVSADGNVEINDLYMVTRVRTYPNFTNRFFRLEATSADNFVRKSFSPSVITV